MTDGQPKKLAIATAAEVADLDDEGRLLAQHLGELGLDVRAEVWNDRNVVWHAYDFVIVRSTWDYALRRDDFVAWAEEVGRQTQIANPPAMIRWTTDKRYLQDLNAAGVPTVQSILLIPAIRSNTIF